MRTTSSVLLVLVLVFTFPIWIGLVGGAIGIVAGIFGAVIGVVAGVFGALIGAIGGIFGWLFDWNWYWPGNLFFFHVNIFAVAAIVLLVVVLLKARR